ncbi:hypothetical protein DFQ30_003173 [Apophysomyces sp. BC1015]|nr:hypothetical protein DFQ30_003173 [Apophysomyces sp. BC1015]
MRRGSRASNVRFVLSLTGSHASKKTHRPETSMSTVSGQSIGEPSLAANSYYGLVNRIRNHSKASSSSRTSSAAGSTTTTKRETTWFDGGAALAAAVNAATSASGFTFPDALDATFSETEKDKRTSNDFQKLIDEQLPNHEERPIIPKYLSEMILMNLFLLPENEPERRKEHDK